jgi:hypothetical protein
MLPFITDDEIIFGADTKRYREKNYFYSVPSQFKGRSRGEV